MQFNWGASYTSIIGEGTARILVDPEEKINGLNCIMAQYSSRTFEFGTQDLAETAVIEVKISRMTAKRSG